MFLVSERCVVSQVFLLSYHLSVIFVVEKRKKKWKLQGSYPTLGKSIGPDCDCISMFLTGGARIYDTAKAIYVHQKQLHGFEDSVGEFNIHFSFRIKHAHYDNNMHSCVRN